MRKFLELSLALLVIIVVIASCAAQPGKIRVQIWTEPPGSLSAPNETLTVDAFQQITVKVHVEVTKVPDNGDVEVFVVIRQNDKTILKTNCVSISGLNVVGDTGIASFSISAPSTFGSYVIRAAADDTEGDGMPCGTSKNVDGSGMIELTVSNPNAFNATIVEPSDSTLFILGNQEDLIYGGSAPSVIWIDNYVHNSFPRINEIPATSQSIRHTWNNEPGQHILELEGDGSNNSRVIYDTRTVCMLSEWDRDGDGLSDAIELNTANELTNPGFDVGFTNDIDTRAVGTWTNGSLTKGLNLVDYHTPREEIGYYHYLGGKNPQTNKADTVDSDDWGAFESIVAIETVAQEWYCFFRNETGTERSRIGIGDISRQDGGTFYALGLPLTQDHASHQNGLDIDVRFVMKDRNWATSTNLTNPTVEANFDMEGTIRLIELFREHAPGGLDRILLDVGETGISSVPGVFIEDRSTQGDHRNHIHFRLNKVYQ